MAYRIVIPVRPPEEGKSRLAGALAPRARAVLIERMLRHVLAVAARSVSSQHICVVSRSPLLLDIATNCGTIALCETGYGLNAALEQAASVGNPAQPILALSADLPLLHENDLAAMMAALENNDMVAASDRVGTGTNALLLRHSGSVPYAFGEASLARHCALATQEGCRVAIVNRQGLAADIDLPSDISLVQIGPATQNRFSRLVNKRTSKISPL